MTPQRRLQHSFGDGLIREEISELWEPWMRQADQILEDDSLVEMVQTAFAKRCQKSRTRGRPGTPADVILRLLLLKHMRDWSFQETEREVRANLVYREFTRIGAGTVPDNKSISRFSRQIGPEVIEKLHQRVVSIARENNVVQGRKLRVDTTVDVATLCYTSLSL
jgi:IS5 family transposase